MEIELKLQIPASALDVLRTDPLLNPASGTRVARKQLDNIYFDTPKHALAQAHIGLRLRKDGRRWLQTVKSGGTVQAGLHSREEIEFAVAGKALEWGALQGTPFGALIEPHRAHLQPQFRTRFTRELRLLKGESGADIELAIDQGQIIAGKRSEALCEIELELKNGPVDDLFALALDLVARHPLVLDNRSKAERGNALARDLPPAPPAKAAELQLPPGTDARGLAPVAIENCLAQWQANEGGFLAQSPQGDAESEYLHQLRVAVRRLRVACDPLARLLGWHTDVLATLKAPLRQLGQHLGAARDWDVFMAETWPLLRASLKDAELQLALEEEIESRRALAQQRAQAALHGRAAQRILVQLGRCLAQSATETVPPSVAGSAFGEQLDALDRKLRQALPNLEKLKPEALHALRIVAKKQRYLTEFSAGLYDARATEQWLKWLKKAQDVLGARNDRVVAEARIASLCKTLDARHGKVKRSLIQSLRDHELPALHLPDLPDPYWR